MAGQLSRGWSMAKASFTVLKQHPKLAILPAMSGTIFLLIIGAILASLMPQFGIGAFRHRLDLDMAQQRPIPQHLVLSVRLRRALCHDGGGDLLQRGADPLRAPRTRR